MKSIFCWLVLVVSIATLISACASSEEEKEEFSTSSSSGGSSSSSLADTIISELSSNLSSSSSSRSPGRHIRVSYRNTSKTLSNSLTSAQISTITTAAKTTVTAASLDSSEDLIALMPKIVEGAQKKIADLSISSAESIKVINVIDNSMCKSLDGKSQYLPSASAETGLTANETVLKLITSKSVELIDEAGLGASNVGEASSEIVETMVSSLGSCGLSSSELSGVIGNISGGAVDALDGITATGFDVSLVL